MTDQARHELAHGLSSLSWPTMLAGPVDQVVDHPCIKHAWIATTMGYVNPRELHRTRAYSQVAC